jgi:multiple sugar transport system substrate-binding protein
MRLARPCEAGSFAWSRRRTRPTSSRWCSGQRNRPDRAVGCGNGFRSGGGRSGSDGREDLTPGAEGVSRRQFLKLGGAGLAGATLLGGCSTKAYLGHVGAAFTGSESVSADTVVFSFGPDESGTLVAVIDRFNKENDKGVKVQYREMPADTGQYFDKVRTEFQSGGGTVDVIGGDVIWPIQFAANGWIEDLSDLFDEQMRSEYLEAPLQTTTYKGGVYGVPWYTDAGMLYYRRDLLEKAGVKEPPKTWNELEDISRRIVDEGDAEYGMVFQGAEYEGGVCNGCEYIWTAGGNVLDEEDPSKVVIESPEAVSGLETQRRLVQEGTAPEAVVVYKEQETHTAFLGGGYVFIRNWPYMFGLASDPALSSLKPDQIGVSPLPVEQEGDQSYSALGGWNFLINKSSTKKEQAWEFVRFMSEESIQRDFAIKASLLPTRKKIYDDKEVIKKQPAVELAKEVTANARPRPIHPFYSDMSLAMSEGFNESLKGIASPGATVSDLGTELERLTAIGEEVFNVGEN